MSPILTRREVPPPSRTLSLLELGQIVEEYLHTANEVVIPFDVFEGTYHRTVAGMEPTPNINSVADGFCAQRSLTYHCTYNSIVFAKKAGV